MNSSIKVDFVDADGTGLQPVIAIKLVESDDVRDQLLKTFFQQLGGKSSWLSVSFDHSIQTEPESKTFITIHPITPKELAETISIITDRLDKSIVQSSPENCNPLISKSKGHKLTF